MLSELLSLSNILGIVALAGVSLALLKKHWYRSAQVLFAVAAVLFCAKVIIWSVASTHGFKVRVVSAIVACLVVSVSGVWAIVKVQSEICDAESNKGDVSTGKQIAPAQVEEPKPKDRTPKTLHQLFRSDFNHVCNIHSQLEFKVENGITGELKGKVLCEVELLVDLDGRSEFVAYYIPASPLTVNLGVAFIDQYKKVVDQFKREIGFEGGFPGERRTSLKDLVFTKRIYIYHETILMQEQQDLLEAAYKENELSLILRGPTYRLDANNPRPIPPEATVL